MRSLFFALSLAAAFFLCIPSSFAVMTRQDIIDLHERSLENLHKGQSDAAYAGYLLLLREEPGNPDINFMMGEAAFAQGNYPMAVFSYIRVLKADPGHERARLELARAYDKMGQSEMSSAELDALRAINPDLPPADEMRKVFFEKPYSPWAFQATLGSGVFYDSNANLGTSASEYLGYTLAQGRKEESYGMYFNGGLDVAYQLGEGSPWYLVGDFSVTDRQYFNPDVDRRLTWVRSAFGLRWATEKILAEIRGKGEFLGRDAGAVTRNVGAEASFVYMLTQNWALVTRGIYEYRDYAYDFKDMRGRHGQVGEYIRYQFGESRHELLLGGHYFIDDARDERYDRYGFEALGRIQFNWPWQIKTGFLASWRATRYDAPPTDLGGGNRWEDQFIAGFDVEKGITERLSLNAQAQYTKNASNHSLYRYDQWLLTTGLTYTF